MTETNTAAGSSPGGVSDVRSTATVASIVPCTCGTIRTCCVPTCVDDATVKLDAWHSYCDEHAVDVFAPRMRVALLNEYRHLLNYVDDVIDLDDYVGQGRFVSYDLFYPRRARVEVGQLRTKTFRHGRVKCDRCGATWVGVELDVCTWCIRRAVLISDGANRRRNGQGGRS